MSEQTDADGFRTTTDRTAVADDGTVYEVPDYAPKRVRLDRHGRPELFMDPALLGAGAAVSRTRAPKKQTKAS